MSEAQTLEFPKTAIVGSLGELAEELSKGTEVPAEFIYVAAMTVLGSMCTGELTVDVGLEVDPRFYTVLLGESYDVKKSTAMKRAIEFFGTLGSTRYPNVMYGIGSAEGLARNLQDNPKTLLAFDELRSFLDKTKVQSSVLLPMTASLYEQHHWQNSVKDREHDVAVTNARVSLLACCTKDTYEHMWSSEAVAIGFPNRLFVVGAEKKAKVAWPEKPDDTLLASIRTRLVGQLSRLPLSIGIAADAKREWESLYLGIPSSEHAKRLDTLGFRLLALVAFITDKSAIDVDTVQIVRSILDYELRMRQLTDPIDADNMIAKLEEKIRRVLQSKGPQKPRDLKKAVNAHRVGIWAFDRAAKNLSGASEVYMTADGKFAFRDESKIPPSNVPSPLIQSLSVCECRT